MNAAQDLCFGQAQETPICRPVESGRFVGTLANPQTGAAILTATNSSTLRWATPGMMMTMEFNASRVTVRLGPDGKILGVNCG